MAPDLHTLTGAYAADAMDDDEERRDFEQHLSQCPDCREEVRTLRETVAVLAAATALPPPPRMRPRVMAEAAATRQWPPPRSARRAPSRLNRLVAVAASVVALAGLAFGGFGLLQAQQEHDRAVAARQQAEQIVSVLADGSARRTVGVINGGGQATLTVSGSQAVLHTSGISGLPSQRIYQLWVLRADQVRAAGLGPAGGGAAGSWNRLVDGVRPGDKVAISVEPSGGSEQPTSTPITVLQA
jgi:anti-sigma-K factor RskA